MGQSESLESILLEDSQDNKRSFNFNDCEEGEFVNERGINLNSHLTFEIHIEKDPLGVYLLKDKDIWEELLLHSGRFLLIEYKPGLSLGVELVILRNLYVNLLHVPTPATYAKYQAEFLPFYYWLTEKVLPMLQSSFPLSDSDYVLKQMILRFLSMAHVPHLLSATSRLTVSRNYVFHQS